MRIILVYFFSFLFILISFGVMILTKSYQRSLTDEYNVDSCPSTSVTQDQALKDYLNPKGERAGFMHCYCLQQYNSLSYKVRDIEFSDGGTYCSSWYTSYVSSIVLSYILAFTMQFINVIVKTILRLASVLEKRADKTEIVISNTFKMFMTQILNSAIVLLIVNMNLGFMPSWFPIFAGDYADFTTKWYSDVGATIMIFMMFSIVTPHFANLFLHFIRFTRRCLDRGCTCNKKRTRKIFQTDYESLYLGPEYLIEFRYSNMITMIFLALMFGAGMPILYFFASCIFLITYWIDKLTLLRIYRKPPCYGVEVMKFSRDILTVAIILHFGFAFWMYSNQLVFDSYKDNLFNFGVRSIDDISTDSYSWLRFDQKINQYHTFAYALGFGLFIIIFALK